MICTWCGTECEPCDSGGFCREDCRRDFNTACRLWGAHEYEAERVSIFELRPQKHERAQWLSYGNQRMESGEPKFLKFGMPDARNSHLPNVRFGSQADSDGCRQLCPLSRVRQT